MKRHSVTTRGIAVTKHAYGSEIKTKWNGADVATTGLDTAGGAISGAAIGTMVFPGIGTAAGAIVGGVIGLAKGLLGSSAKAKQRAMLKEANRQQTIQNMDNRVATDSQESYKITSSPSFYLKGGKMNVRFHSMGGSVPGANPLSHDTEMIVGPRHEGGGVQYGPNDEVEGGETTMKQGDGTMVFSDRLKVPNSNLTYADASKPLMERKGELEGKFAMVEKDIEKERDYLKNAKHPVLDSNSAKRRAQIGGMKSEKILMEIESLNAQLEVLFNMQEQANGNAEQNPEGEVLHAGGGFIGKMFKCIGNLKLGKIFEGGTDSQLGLQAGADMLDTLSQSITSYQMSKLPTPNRAMVKPIRFNSYVDNSGDIASIDASAKATGKFIGDNVRNSQVRRASMISLTNKINAAKSQSFMNKFRMETDIENKNAQLVFDSVLRNNESSFANSTDKFNSTIAGLNRQSQIAGNFADKVSALGTSKAQLEANDMSLGAILTQYPEPVRNAILKSMSQGKSFKQALLGK